MKKLLGLAFTLVAGVSALAQGTINFNNGAAGVNAPIFDIDGTTKLAGTGFSAQLWAGPAGTAWDSLTAITPTATFGTGVSAGYLSAATGAGARTIAGVATGSTAAFQFRVWNAAFATWDAAWAAYQAGDTTAKVGVNGWAGSGLPTSVLTSPALGGGATPPPNLLGLTSFQLYQAVPEPSTIALGLLGAAALLLRRRK